MAPVGLAREKVDRREMRLLDNGHHEYHREFWAQTNNRQDDGNVALSTPGLPARFFAYVTGTTVDVKALCNDIRAVQRRGSTFYWDISADYTTDVEGLFAKQDNPLLEPPDIEFGFERTTRIVTGSMKQEAASANVNMQTVIHSTGIVTSAGEPYDPPPEIEDSRPVLTVSRNEANFNVQLAVEYQDAINTDFFLGVFPGQAKISSITARRRQTNNLRYWRVTYRIVFRRDFWTLQLLDRGTFHLVGGIITHFQEDGMKRLGLLDGNGVKLGAGADAVFNVFRVYRERPFAALNLPVTIEA